MTPPKQDGANGGQMTNEGRKVKKTAGLLTGIMIPVTGKAADAVIVREGW